jgi:hypothetical protein
LGSSEIKEVSRKERGASVAWITLFGALIGVAALIPIFPYVGGGGYIPLTVLLACIAPMLLGPTGGISAAVIGGFIGMFIAPGGFPLGLMDVVLNSVLPATVVMLFINNDRLWVWNLLGIVVVALMNLFFPYYVPGAAAGFETPPQPLFWLLSAYYWLPPLIVAVTPVGRRLVPAWLRGEVRSRKYAALIISLVAGLLAWWVPWSHIYWYVFKFPAALGVATFIGYTWWVPAVALITAVIAMALLEALSRTGMRKIQRALW